jgi:hypothetical protein
MSFSPNIFTNLPLVHTLNPDFFGTTTLTLLLRRFVNVFTRDSRTRSSTDSRIGLRFFVGSCMNSRMTPELGPRQIPESAVLRSSCHRQLEVPGFRMFATPFLYRIKIPELHTFTNSRLHRFQASENREFPIPEKHVSRTLSTLSFRG